MNTLIEQHAEYMRRDRAKDAAREYGECPCSICGCVGNNACGHYCLSDEDFCTLVDDSLVCPCCRIAKEAGK